MALAALAVVLGGGGWLGYNVYAGREGADDYITKSLARGDIVRTVSATGTIEPLVKVIVGSQVSGIIKKWYADFNDEVAAGFVLAEIDPDRFQTVQAQAVANLALARAREEELLVRLKDGEREYKRILSLRKLSNASENELLVAETEQEAARAVWHGAQASVESAEAALNAAKVDLERTLIRSPIDGVVIARNIEDGQTVAASLQAPELFVIANDLRHMQVNANVSEADIGAIREGKPATFRVDAYPGRQFKGTISQIRYNATDLDGVVTYVTLIEVSNDDLSLRPGMTANVTFEVARAANVIRIPNAALRFDPNPREPTGGRPQPGRSRHTPSVYILKEGRPSKVEVEIGLSDGSMSELKGDALAEGEAVITERNWLAGSGRSPDITRSLRR
jgi:HlyD family secretion protein